MEGPDDFLLRQRSAWSLQDGALVSSAWLLWGGGGGAVIVILRLAAPESLAASPGSQISCIPFRLWDDALTASGAKTQSPSFFLK